MRYFLTILLLFFSTNIFASQFCLLDESSDLCKLSKIKAYADANIKYTPDIEQFGVIDKWFIPGGPNMRGDCEDMALFIKYHAQLQGVSNDKLSLAVCLTKGSTKRFYDHAILIYDNQWIFDNNLDKPVHKVQYGDSCRIHSTVNIPPLVPKPHTARR